MREIALDARLARVIAQILRDRWTGIARSDAICHALSDIIMSATAERTGADMALRRKIRTELEAAAPIANDIVDVDVHDGIVELRGIVRSELKRREIFRLASQVDGILAIHDHLIDVDPDSGAFLLSSVDLAADFTHPDIHRTPATSPFSNQTFTVEHK